MSSDSFENQLASLLADGGDFDADKFTEVLSSHRVPDSQSSERQVLPKDSQSSLLSTIPFTEGEVARTSEVYVDPEKEISDLCLKEAVVAELQPCAPEAIMRVRKELKRLKREYALNVEEAKKTDSNVSAVRAVLEQEAARLQYLLAWYYRSRLAKVEAYCDEIMTQITLLEEREGVNAFCNELKENQKEGKGVSQEEIDDAEAKRDRMDEIYDRLKPCLERLVERLYDEELDYVKKYSKIKSQFLQEAFLSKLPSELQEEHDGNWSPIDSQREVLERWNRNFVFFRSEKKETLALTSELVDAVKVEEGDVVMAPYVLASEKKVFV